MGGRLYGRAERNPNFTIGERIKRVREDRDLSQPRLTEMMNEILIAHGAIGLPKYGQIALCLVENGKRSLSAIELMALCAVLRIHPMAFAPWEEMNDHSPWLPARFNRSLILELPFELPNRYMDEVEQEVEHG